MAKQNFDYDLIVIGSGAAGSVAAEIVARAGRRVAIIENGTLGGQAPMTADIPVQALLTAAHTYDRARQGAAFGLRSQTLGYNYPSVKAWKDLAVKRSGAAASEDYFRSRGISVFRGAAHFISPNEITVNRRHLSAVNFLVASGSRWYIPDIVGLGKIDYLTPDTAIDLMRPPKSLFIVGAGESGTEMAELFSIFGTKVTLADIKKRILPKSDDEVSELVENAMHTERGVNILTSARVIRVAFEGLLTRVTYLRGNEEHTTKVEKVLIAAGRTPNIDLGLTNARVNFSENGIEVNENLQSSAHHIYAAGDVIGRMGQTHTAILESRTTAANILGKKLSPDYRAMPHVIHLYPEVASVGLNETDLARGDIKHKKIVVPIAGAARASTANFYHGFVKLITDKQKVLIGATIVAPTAGEMIHELALAIQYGMTTNQVAEVTHAFGSWSEVIRMACAKLR